MSEIRTERRAPVRPALRGYQRDTYVRGAAKARDESASDVRGPDTIDCATGVFESEPSPRVVEVLRRIEAVHLVHYPPAPLEAGLKRAIVERFQAEGLLPDHVFLGHGSFNLIERLIHKFLAIGTVAGVGPQFSEVPSEFVAAGGQYVAIPLEEPNASLPVTALERGLAAGEWSTLYIDNPNNPLGRAFALHDLARLAAASDRAGAALIIDEAFGDYLDDRSSAIHLAPRYRHVAVVRSFSKALGLAGERVGYLALSAPLATRYAEIDVPFEPGVVGQMLAIETLADAERIARIRLEVRAAKARMTAALGASDIRILPTHPDVAIMSLHRPGRDIVREMRDRGVIVLPGSSFVRTHSGWDDCYCRLRVVRGTELDRLCERLASL
jgi:histidinol-phosphate/aromatic aminotransferase/cobyric acid decarboxylase-like protein